MSYFFKKPKSGQSILEYSAILILVMVGIIVGGPYAIRGWNAHLKGWDDSIKDSIQDPLVDTPPDLINVPECTCGPWTDGGCGTDSSTNPDGDCEDTEMYRKQICNPLGCNPNPVEACVSHMSCCVLAASGQPTLPDDCGDTTIDCYLDQFGTPVYCSETEACFTFECSNDRIPERRCVFDARCYVCQGGDIDNAVLCPGDDVGLSGPMIYNTGVNVCTDETKCEWLCTPPYFADGGVCTSCGVGQAYRGSCDGNPPPLDDQCETGLFTCGPNQCAY